MKVYYNEFDTYAAQWLRNLITAGLIPAGDVDDRDIRNVQPGDLDGYEQCHFFAGIAGWPYALDLAGWGTRPVWTASCPCQPFSAAGKRKGADDERHLWPELLRLIAARRHPTIIGEQVASADGRKWLAGVRLGLEALGYRVGAADLCAAGVAAPHIRQRLFWVADTGHAKRGARDWSRNNEGRDVLRQERQEGSAISRQRSEDGGLAHAGCEHARGGVCGPGESLETANERPSNQSGGSSDPCGMGDAEFVGIRVPGRGPDECAPGRMQGTDGQRERVRSEPWSASELIDCADGKTRRIEPGTFPLAHGIPNRVGKLRAYGNAIVPQVAAQFISAYLEVEAA